MAQVTNKQLVDSIVNEGTDVLRTSFASVNTGDGQAVYELLSNFEEVKNAFINTLVNRCVKVQFFSKIYDNPLKMLHNGLIPYGDSIQQIFVRLGERKGFNEHFESSGTAENDLIGKRVPQVDVDYISQNFAHKYKVSISELQLKTAFLNEGGLGSLVAQLVSNNLSTAEKDEFEDMKGILTRTQPETKDGHTYGKGVIQLIADNERIRDTAIIPCGQDVRNLCKNIRAYSKKLGFVSDKYNLAGVPTWTGKDELIFFTTPEVSAEIDVNVLAQAFNVGMADIEFRTIIIDELPKNLMSNGQSKGDVIGVLADKNLIQAWDIINTSKTFDNGDALYTNYFLHKQGIMNMCKFANCLVFTNK